MASSLPKIALTQKSFPLNMTFQSPHGIQDFARKFLFRFFMNIYMSSKEPMFFPSFHPDHIFLTRLVITPNRDITEDELWYVWCLTVLYATKMVFPVLPLLTKLNDPKSSTSLTWTLFEWFSPLPSWRRKLQQIADTHHLLELPDQEGKQFTVVFIIHRPCFQHHQTRDFWTQNQSYEWIMVPHIACLEQDFHIKTSLKNFLMELNHIPPDQPEILHTSLGPKYEMFMIPTPSLHSQPLNLGIIIKEEKPDYTDFLFQDSQDPYEDFTPVPSPSPYEFPRSFSS